MTEKKPIVEALKEGGRVVLLAAVSYLLSEGVLDIIVDYIFGVKLDTALKVQIAGIVTIVLRAIDKYLHEKGVNNDDPNLKAGLTRF